MKTKIGLAVLGLLILAGSFYLGRSTAKPQVIWFSDINPYLGGGPKQYLMDVPVKCANGKDLGKIQVDLNLTNGKLRVVRNDPGKTPSCEK
jgi:hypothetical protein